MNKPTDQAQIETLIRKFIARDILLTGTDFPYPDEASLLQEGIIDSLGVMELVEFVQATFGVKVEQAELKPEHFDSVARLATFVRSKAATRPPTPNPTFADSVPKN
jgi:acyl carrier protein